MKKILLLFFILCWQFSFGQITFQESIYDTCNYPGNYAFVNDMKETPGNGYIVTGTLQDGCGNNFSQNSFLINMDKNGDTIWTKYFNSLTLGESVMQTCDGGYITLGNGGFITLNDSTSFGKGISKIDGAGNLLWSKYYPSLALESSFVIKTNDCGYMLAAVTDSFGAGGNDIYVVKTDTGGVPLWSKTYGGVGDDEPTAIQQTSDGGYIIAGYTSSFDTSGYLAYLIKTDSNGDTLWTKTYGQPTPSNYGGSNYSVQQTYDHGYILFGDHLIKTDSDGNVKWSNNFYGYSIQQTLDSGYIFPINYYNSPNESTDLFLIKTNITGNFLWARDFPGDYRVDVSGSVVLQTQDGGYIGVGEVSVHDDLAFPYSYAVLIKMDAKGHSGCYQFDTTVTVSPASIAALGTSTIVTSPVTTVIDTSQNLAADLTYIYLDCYSDAISEVHSENSLTIYPNPATSQLTIHTSSFHNNEAITVSIMNVLGQKASPPTPLQRRGEEDATIYVGNLSAGMYFVSIVSEKERWVGKFVKE